MNKINLPVVGDKIEIETPKNMTEVNKKILISQILDIANENIFFISTPIIHNVYHPIPLGEVINITYSIKNSGVYIFKAKVIERKNRDNVSYMKIEKIGDVNKTQRRNFFRLEVFLNVLIDFTDSNGNTKSIQAVSKDLSGGGIRVISKKHIFTNSVVKVMIDTKPKPIIVEGKVIRCFSFINNDYDVGITFDEIDETSRNNIVSFVFEHQRKMRKKDWFK